MLHMSRCGVSSTTHSTGRRPPAALQGPVEQDTSPIFLAPTSSRGSTHRLGASTPREQTLRLGSVLPPWQQGASFMYQDSAALSRHRLRPSAASGHTGRTLVDLLPGAQEGHRQDARICRPPLPERVHQVRALQDGGATHSSPAPSSQRLHHQDRHQRLLPSLHPPPQGQQVHAVHVGGSEVRVHRHALRLSSSPLGWPRRC